MQHAGWKTSEKAISVKVLQDFAPKSLFSTLFMMFNSRYRGSHRQPGGARNHPPMDWPNVLIVNAGEAIKDFAVHRGGSPPVRGPVSRKKNRSKRKLVVGMANCSSIHRNFWYEVVRGFFVINRPIQGRRRHWAGPCRRSALPPASRLPWGWRACSRSPR